MFLFQYFNKSQKFDFQYFLKRKEFLKEKTFCSLFKKDPYYNSESIENQKPNEQAMTNSINSFNERKNKEQTKVVFSMKTKMIFQTNKKMRKTKHSTFNQSLVLN
jgi:hypothetical protein